jgi:hypothetical protein
MSWGLVLPVVSTFSDKSDVKIVTLRPESPPAEGAEDFTAESSDGAMT